MFVVADKRERLEKVFMKWQQRLGSTLHQIMVGQIAEHVLWIFLAITTIRDTTCHQTVI